MKRFHNRTDFLFWLFDNLFYIIFTLVIVSLGIILVSEYAISFAGSNPVLAVCIAAIVFASLGCWFFVFAPNWTVTV